MKLKWTTLFTLVTFPYCIWSSSITPLPTSFGALMYDTNYSAGPDSHATISPGLWSANIQAFNASAKPANQITRLYPYSSDIEITGCVGTNLNTCQIDPGYATGNHSVSSYRAAVPNAIIMPIVDISFGFGNNASLKTNTQLADMVAQSLATQICSDPNANGVFFDIEIANSLTYPGLVEFYTQVSTLFAAPPCVDTNHPKGRYMGIYLTPTGDAWTTLATIFSKRNNAFIAIPLYDVKGFSSPPSPDPLSLYNGYVTPQTTNAKANANSYQVPYTIIVPAGASFGTFQSYGVYTNNPSVDYNYNYQVVKDFSSSNSSQLGFVQAARNAACSNNNAYFMGMDYWSWQQYIYDSSTDPNNPLRGPNLPDPSTVSYLGSSASCF